MCTVIVRVAAREPARLLAVRDEDPARAWNPLGAWWPDTHPGLVGVRDVRAGGAWLAADPAAGRLAVLLNRAETSDVPAERLRSRGAVVVETAAGHPPREDPRTNGFNLVEIDGDEVRVTQWDGAQLRTRVLEPGVHMIAHDDLDDPRTVRIDRWLAEFRAATPPAGPAHSLGGSGGAGADAYSGMRGGADAGVRGGADADSVVHGGADADADADAGAGAPGGAGTGVRGVAGADADAGVRGGADGTPDGWFGPWLDVLARSARLDATDDAAIIRDNRAHGFPTLSLLLCTATVAPGRADVTYRELPAPARLSTHSTQSA